MKYETKKDIYKYKRARIHTYIKVYTYTIHKSTNIQ